MNPESIFDAQAKRLHEYKRQLMNALGIMMLYNDIDENPDKSFHARTFIFGAKAAPGYHRAKLTIKLINAVGDLVRKHPRASKLINVVFLENYCVSQAELLMPATDVSEQISTAGKEASGTGCMKLMMNGAVTIGTLDGANVEMYERLGDENMFLFGLHTDEIANWRAHGYDPNGMAQADRELYSVCMHAMNGFADGKNYSDVISNVSGIDVFLDGHGC